MNFWSMTSNHRAASTPCMPVPRKWKGGFKQHRDVKVGARGEGTEVVEVVGKGVGVIMGSKPGKKGSKVTKAVKGSEKLVGSVDKNSQ